MAIKDMRAFLSRKELDKLKHILKTKGRRILFYHHDADGISSAALFLKFFPDFKAIPREGPAMEDDFVKNLIEQKPDVLVFVDIPVGQEHKKIKKLKKSLPETEMAVIDHHIVEYDLNKIGILHVNPKFQEDIYIPASALCYEIMERLGKKVKPFIWIASIGIIGDYGFVECASLLNQCSVVYPELTSSNPLESKLGKGAEMISSAVTLNGLKGAKKALEEMVDAENYYEFIENENLRKWHKKVRKSIDDVLEDFRKEKEEYHDVELIVYEIKSELNLTSVISSILARLYPEEIILIRKKTKGGYKISIRMQSGRLNMGDIVKKCVKSIGSGGGHKKAAGALVSDWEKFKKRFIRSLEKAQ